MTDTGVQSFGGIVTPEGVVLSFVEAGLGSRALAFILDLLIRVAVVFGLGVFFVMLDIAGDTLVIMYTIAIFSAILVYPVVLEVSLRGRTPGKMALGLRVVTVEGGPVRFRHAAIRSGLGLIDFYVSTGIVAVLSSLFNRRSQRVGDVVAGTMVVRERSARTSSMAISFVPPHGWESFAASLNTTPLSTDLSILVRDFLLRVDSLDFGARWHLGNEFAARVGERIGTPLPPGSHPEAYLISVIAADQRAHTEPASVPTRPRIPERPADDLSPTWGT